MLANPNAHQDLLGEPLNVTRGPTLSSPEILSGGGCTVRTRAANERRFAGRLRGPNALPER